MNSWIASEGLTSENVRMYRWYESKWNELDTKVLKTDTTYTYYEVKTSAFMFFAISGLKTVPTVSPGITTVQPAPTVKASVKVTETAPPSVGQSSNLVLIIGVFILIAIIIVVYLRRK